MTPASPDPAAPTPRMQLYSAAISPYAARVRIQVLHKRLPVDIVPPPGGLGSDAVKAANPIGKIPVLDLGGRTLSESWAIMGYLETRHPAPPMRPADAYAAAKLEERVRYADLYLAPAMFPLFRALRGALPESAVPEALQQLQAQFATLEALLAAATDDPAIELNLANAALLPIVYYAQVLAGHWGLKDCLAPLPATRAWWTRCRAVAAAETVLGEIDAGLRAAMPALFAKS